MPLAVLPYRGEMADRFAEVREIQDRIVALGLEFDRSLLRPWPWGCGRRRQIREEITAQFALLDAAMAKAEAAAPKRRSDPFRRAVSVRYEPPG